MLLGCDLDWFAVVTIPQNEIRARDNLARRKVDCFVPTYSKVVRQRGRKRFVERRLFPGYVLVGFEPGQTRWDIVRDAGGVFAIVAAAGRPLRIPSDHIGTLMVGAMLGRFDVEQHRLGAKVTMRLPSVAGNPIKRFGRIVSLVEKGDHPGVSVLWGGHGPESFSTVPLDALELAA
ncbi:transcription termination/antitermination NusG family protein [Lichenifustis flavocetrariae]|uniref:transcription termination/antitermination NusG family protein n=1 Tax=Lichenifustis flavocetrariae TaxID=2949735 RepID=UPI0024A62D6D|nr:transcription termination/antitermination NusG family protein [Lichenifustis flavocetrariae]